MSRRRKDDGQGSLFLHQEYGEIPAIAAPPPRKPPPPPTSNGGNDGEEGESPFRNRQEQIFAGFKRFHKDNPTIWKLFVHFAFALIESGWEIYGVAAIIERIRWKVNVETRTDKPFKICNDYRAYYARMFNAVYKDKQIFKLRVLRSQQRPPNNSDEVWIDPPPDPAREAELMAELEKMGRDDGA